MVNYYLPILKERYNVIEDKKNPEYILASIGRHSIINGNKYMTHGFLEDFPNAKIRIFLQHEAVLFDLNLFDYAVVYTEDIKWGDRVFFSNYFSSGYLDPLGKDVFDRLFNKDLNANKIFEQKSKFCNFLYSHGRGASERTDFFYLLSNYKKVDSIGKHLNNVPAEAINKKEVHYHESWFEESVELKKPYRFSIAFENALHPYGIYVTEKLVSSMLAGTIPIYWGTQKVGEYFNVKSFINCHEFEKFEDVVKKVQEIDQNEELWMKLMSEPWFSPEQYEKLKARKNELHNFLYNIFDQPLDKATRRSSGLWMEHYQAGLLENIKSYQTLQNIRTRGYNSVLSKMKRKITWLLRKIPGGSTTIDIIKKILKWNT